MTRRGALATLASALLTISLTAACSEPLPEPMPRPIGSKKVATGEPLPNLPDIATPTECRGYVAITFDDGPTDLTDEILTILSYYDVPATFFNVGVAELAYPQLVKRISEAGHQFGNHTMSHPDLSTLAEKKARAEIVDASNVHVELGLPAFQLFRPPYGATNDKLRAMVEKMGMTEVIWTVDSKDYEASSPEQVATQSDGMSDGGILLMHDGKRSTVEALPRIIANYYDQDLCFGRIGAGSPKMTPIGIPTKARATKLGFI